MNRIYKNQITQKGLSRLFICNLLIFFVLMCCVNTVYAAVWLLDPRAVLEYEYDDNFRLSSDSSTEDEVSTARLVGELALRGKSEHFDLEALVRLDKAEHGGDDSNLRDRSNQTLGLSSRYRLSQRNQVSLKGNLFRDSILRTEQIDLNPDDFLVGGDGVALESDQDIDPLLIEADVRRTRFSVKPGWMYKLNDKTTIGMQYTYRDLSFSGDSGTGLVESNRQTIGANISRDITERDKITGNISAAYFRPDNIGSDNDVDTYEARVRWNRKISETLQMDFSIGGRESKFDNGQKSSDSGYVANIGATKYIGRTTYRLNAERGVSPSASGNQVEVDELSANIRHGITEKLEFDLAARFFDTESTGDISANSDREYFSIGPGLSWQFLRSWNARVSFEYREIDRDNDPNGSADSNSAFFSISYRPPRQF